MCSLMVPAAYSTLQVNVAPQHGIDSTMLTGNSWLARLEWVKLPEWHSRIVSIQLLMLHTVHMASTALCFDTYTHEAHMQWQHRNCCGATLCCWKPLQGIDTQSAHRILSYQNSFSFGDGVDDRSLCPWASATNLVSTAAATTTTSV